MHVPLQQLAQLHSLALTLICTLSQRQPCPDASCFDVNKHVVCQHNMFDTGVTSDVPGLTCRIEQHSIIWRTPPAKLCTVSTWQHGLVAHTACAAEGTWPGCLRDTACVVSFVSRLRTGPRGRVVACVEPRVGRALLHRHGAACLEHEGRAVRSGVKYVLRSDVVFA